MYDVQVLYLSISIFWEINMDVTLQKGEGNERELLSLVSGWPELKYIDTHPGCPLLLAS